MLGEQRSVASSGQRQSLQAAMLSRQISGKLIRRRGWTPIAEFPNRQLHTLNRVCADIQTAQAVVLFAHREVNLARYIEGIFAGLVTPSAGSRNHQRPARLQIRKLYI